MDPTDDRVGPSHSTRHSWLMIFPILAASDSDLHIPNTALSESVRPRTYSTVSSVIIKHLRQVWRPSGDVSSSSYQTSDGFVPFTGIKGPRCFKNNEMNT